MDLYLSVDGGVDWQLYERGLTGGEHRLVVPHTPTRFAAVKLERADAGDDDWRTLLALTRETTHRDEQGGAGQRYRLFAVNGLGEELLLGEAASSPPRPLAAWPQPYRSGLLTVSFASFGGLGGGKDHLAVTMHDVSGRLIRTITEGAFAAGYHRATWDGMDRDGNRAPAGIYFLRVSTGGQVNGVRLVVLR